MLEQTIVAAGTIQNGDYAGWHLRVQDDRAQTGGWFILITHPEDPLTGYDNWVEDGKLGDYFAHVGWRIEWTRPLLLPDLATGQG